MSCASADNPFRHVVPYVGTWIEMQYLFHLNDFRIGRSLRGNVDRNFLDDGLLVLPVESFPTWERG